MPTYITLGNFTDQGVKNIKDSVKRADAVREAGKKFGVTLKDIYWTMGAYDVVVTFEAPNAEAISALALAVGMAGNVRAQTLAAFNRDQMQAILQKLG